MKLKRFAAVALTAVIAFGTVGFSTSAESAGTQGAYQAPQLSVDLSQYVDENGYITGFDYSAIELVDYKNMVIPTENHMPAQETLNAFMVAQLPQIDATEGVVAMGDTVNIDYAGSVDSVPFEGGTAYGYDLQLGSGAFIQGFEEQVAGHSVGENFDIYVTFPENYHADLAGKDAVFNIYINSYKKAVAVEDITDEMVKENLGGMGLSNVKELNQYAIDELSYSMVGNYIYNEVFGNSTVTSVPQTAIDMQGDYMLASMELEAINYGMNLETMLQMYGFASAEDFKTTYAETIEAAAKEICINQAIANAEGIKITDKDIEEYFGGQDYSVVEEVYGKPFLKFLIMQSITLENLINNTAREGVSKAGGTNSTVIILVAVIALAAVALFFVFKKKKPEEVAAEIKETANKAIEEIKEETAELKAEIKEEIAEIKEEISEEINEIKEDAEQEKED